MNTPSQHRVPDDATIIDLREPGQVEHWCRKLGITETDLRLAIREVGSQVQEVRRYLDRPLPRVRWGERWD